MKTKPPENRIGSQIGGMSLLRRVALAAVLWVILTGGQSETPLLAITVVLLAAYLSLLTIPAGSVRLSARGILRFLPFFLRESLHAGMDVARRAFREPTVPRSTTLDYDSSLPPGLPLSLFVAILGLLPGTLARGREGSRVRIHVLDDEAPIEAQLQRLEKRIADLTGSGGGGAGSLVQKRAD